jgi:hypothetical protein
MTLLSTHWIEQQLRRFTYRHGWHLSVETSPVYEALLLVMYTAQDSRKPNFTVPIPVRIALPVPGYIFSIYEHQELDEAEKVFGKWLQESLFYIERHESREWLRKDGEIYDDPHK